MYVVTETMMMMMCVSCELFIASLDKTISFNIFPFAAQHQIYWWEKDGWILLGRSRWTLKTFNSISNFVDCSKSDTLPILDYNKKNFFFIIPKWFGLSFRFLSMNIDILFDSLLSLAFNVVKNPFSFNVIIRMQWS